MRETVVVLCFRTYAWGRVPAGGELGGTGRQVPFEVDAATDGALGKPNYMSASVQGSHMATNWPEQI